MAVPHIPHFEQPAVLPFVGIGLNLRQFAYQRGTEVATGAGP